MTISRWFEPKITAGNILIALGMIATATVWTFNVSHSIDVRLSKNEAEISLIKENNAAVVKSMDRIQVSSEAISVAVANLRADLSRIEGRLYDADNPPRR